MGCSWVHNFTPALHAWLPLPIKTATATFRNGSSEVALLYVYYVQIRFLMKGVYTTLSDNNPCYNTAVHKDFLSNYLFLKSIHRVATCQ